MRVAAVIGRDRTGSLIRRPIPINLSFSKTKGGRKGKHLLCVTRIQKEPAAGGRLALWGAGRWLSQDAGEHGWIRADAHDLSPGNDGN